MLKQERAFPKLLEAQNSLSLYAVALRCPFTEGPSPNHEKQPQTIIPPPPNFSWHSPLGQVAFSWHPPNPDSSIGLPGGEA